MIWLAIAAIFVAGLILGWLAKTYDYEQITIGFEAVLEDERFGFPDVENWEITR